MKHIDLAVMSLAISLLVTGSLSAEQQAANPLALVPIPEHGPQQVKNCNWCHGTSAQGFAIAPRLAGQRAAYIEKELNAFRDHLRDNPRSKQYMWNAVAHLDPEVGRALAEYYAAEPPRAADDGRREIVDQGRAIYQQGEGAANIVACVVCHGPNGEGVRDIPRLGGLSYLYLKRRMEEWNEGYHPTATPMPAVMRSLSPDEIEALASYLSFIDNQTVGK